MAINQDRFQSFDKSKNSTVYLITFQGYFQDGSRAAHPEKTPVLVL
jgi:hypothetical protein